MKEGFNVAFDPWIPVVTLTGKSELASLAAVFTEGANFADLAVRPHERVALMRLFLCVAHAALNGPRDKTEWLEVSERLPEAAQTYLTTWKDSFELFHEEKPWLQVPGLSKSADGDDSLDEGEGWTPASKLNFAYATGANTTLFDHSGTYRKRSIAVSETLLSMLTFQCFSTAGLIPQAYWNGAQSSKSSKDAPCVPGSMIHAFLRGKDLPTTIHLNIPTYETVRLSYNKRDIGKPVWEIFPASMDDLSSIENATATYVGRLVPIARLIKLHTSSNRILLGHGLVYPTFADGFPSEPTATIVIRQKNMKEERAPLSYRPAKALWRQLAAIVVKRKAEGVGGPWCLKANQGAEECDLIVSALARKQEKVLDTTESVFHIPAQLHSEQGGAAYDDEVKYAEARASKLGWAVETYRKEMDAGWERRVKSARDDRAKLQALASTHYWTTVEKNLPLLMAYIKSWGTDEAGPARDIWRKKMASAARDAYRIACGQETPRQMRAFAKGWNVLTAPQDDQSNAT